MAAASVLAHICIRNSVTREEFMEICQLASDETAKLAWSALQHMISDGKRNIPLR